MFKKVLLFGFMAIAASTLFVSCEEDNAPDPTQNNDCDPVCHECMEIRIGEQNYPADGYNLTMEQGETELIVEFYAGYAPICNHDIKVFIDEAYMWSLHPTIKAELVTPCDWDVDEMDFIGAEISETKKIHGEMSHVYRQYIRITAPERDVDQHAKIEIMRSGPYIHETEMTVVKKAMKK